MSFYRNAVVVFALTFVVLGFVLVTRTAFEGGGVVGFLIGGLFVALGAGRLTLAMRNR
jgi:hypothetical protein